MQKTITYLMFVGDQCGKAAEALKLFTSLFENFGKKQKLRTKKKILEQADLILRLDWACVNARMKNEPAPGNLDKGVVFERHHSLNWLINYMNQDWDNITTDT